MPSRTSWIIVSIMFLTNYAGLASTPESFTRTAAPPTDRPLPPFAPVLHRPTNPRQSISQPRAGTSSEPSVALQRAVRWDIVSDHARPPHALRSLPQRRSLRV